MKTLLRNWERESRNVDQLVECLSTMNKAGVVRACNPNTQDMGQEGKTLLNHHRV